MNNLDEGDLYSKFRRKVYLEVVKSLLRFSILLRVRAGCIADISA